MIRDLSGNSRSITSNSIVSTGTWYYFVITRTSGGNYKMYFNGEEEASKDNVGGDNGTDLDCPNFESHFRPHVNVVFYLLSFFSRYDVFGS